MAKGNEGNLMQHFVLLQAAKAVCEAWQDTNSAIEFVDCYAMAPWEPLEPGGGGQRTEFLNRCETMSQTPDFVSAAFHTAWSARYGTALPGVQDREYPNSAVLLRCAFPSQAFNMRLHDVDNAKRQLLSSLASSAPNIAVRVEGDWTTSPQIMRNPAPRDRPTVVTLDPYRVHHDNHGAVGAGSMRARQLSWLLGAGALDLPVLAMQAPPIPSAVVLFNYNEQYPKRIDRDVRSALRRGNWTVDLVTSGPHGGAGTASHHMAWVALHGCQLPAQHVSLQAAFNQWL